MKTGQQPAAQQLASRTVRRNNAPIRPRRPATTVPDFLIALAACALTMAAIFFGASFLDANVTAGEAGPWLARLFAGALLVTALFLWLLGIGLLRDDRSRADHYITPAAIGLLIGGLEAAMFLWPANDFLFAPFVLLIFVFRPLRRQIARVLHPARRYAG